MSRGRTKRRVLHTSDLHLASLSDRNCETFKEVVDYVNKTDVDLVVIVGDLFDHNRVDDELVCFVAEQLRKLAVPVAILAGNHDCLVSDSVFGRTPLWQSCPNVHIFRGGEGETVDFSEPGISVWGKSIDTYEGHIHPLAGIPQRVKNGRWHIAMAHGYYVSVHPPLFPSYHITQDEIVTSGCDYIALGHIAGFSRVCDGPVIACYSGSPSLTGTVTLVELSEEGVVATQQPLRPMAKP
ncbi:MAG: DNA repair exonuclease [Chloroflexi bacterium]|nr:DNA repair exonuclease [Chloroflexota bacterium]